MFSNLNICGIISSNFPKNNETPSNLKKTGEEESTIMSDLRNAFNYIETSTIGQDSAEDIGGLFSEIEFNSQKFGTTTADKAKMLYSIIPWSGRRGNPTINHQQRIS